MMDKEIYGINEALILLKEGARLKDSLARLFVYKKERIYVYSQNSSYSLDLKEFSKLYIDTKFVIDVDDDSTIDAKKDEEYYGFKHK
jgi:hypothetical protein